MDIGDDTFLVLVYATCGAVLAYSKCHVSAFS